MVGSEDLDVLLACVSTLLIILINVQDIVFNSIHLLGIAPSSLDAPMEIDDVDPHVHDLNHATVIALHSFQLIKNYIFNDPHLGF